MGVVYQLVRAQKIHNATDNNTNNNMNNTTNKTTRRTHTPHTRYYLFSSPLLFSRNSIKAGGSYIIRQAELHYPSQFTFSGKSHTHNAHHNGGGRHHAGGSYIIQQAQST